MNTNNKILILDIETTGFLNRGGKIIEVGIVELNVINGRKRILMDTLCHERPITLQEVQESWIVNNSNITVNDIRHSPQFINLKNQIQTLIDSYPLGITAFNNSFDFGFFESRGIVLKTKLECPMKLSTPILQLPNKWGKGYKWPTVEEAYNHFYPESKYVESHRGADDALHEAGIVYQLIKKGIFKINN